MSERVRDTGSAAIRERVRAVLPQLTDDPSTVDLPAFRVDRTGLLDVMRVLRDAPECGFQYLSCLSGVDYPDHLDVVYHIFNLQNGAGVCLKTSAPKSDPVLPSATAVWPGANWHEREVFDLLGVRFEGHPDLRRILMPEGFDAGYPLRKDFVDSRPAKVRLVRSR